MQATDDIWHRETISADVERALTDLHRASVLDRFYLAGGTALALQFGHRRSVDLDFFGPEGFDLRVLLQSLQQLRGFSLLAEDIETLHAHLRQTKISFLGYRYPVLFRFREFFKVRVADPRDIACMKISAIASRGARRDFIDLYTVSRQFGLQYLLGLFQKKFAQVNYSIAHITKSLTYFEDAEKEPMPDMLIALSWEEVRDFFTGEATRML